MIDTDRAWRIWGETDPYFGVLAAPEYRKDRIDLDRFFHTGRFYADDRLAMLDRQLGRFPRGSALDFGCGVGRVTLPLADHFDTVLGLDISPGMLAEAERLRIANVVDNVAYRPSDDMLGEAPGSFDFVHSYIVFQHIPQARGLPIIGRLLDRVAVGGVANIHVAIHAENRSLGGVFYRARTRIPGLQRLIHFARGRSAGEPTMQMNDYPVGPLIAMMHRRGFGQALIDVERHGRYLTAHVAARRQALAEEVS